MLRMSSRKRLRSFWKKSDTSTKTSEPILSGWTTPCSGEGGPGGSQRRCEKGLLFCGTGVGISIANKVKGIRAVVCSEPYSAKLSREHNDTNILAVGARVVGIELAKMIIETWLTTPFEGGRHATRVEMLNNME